MFHPPLLRACAATVALLGLIGCAAQQPLSSVDRTKYRSVAFNPAIKTPPRYVYRDTIGKRARGIGAQAGLVGVLIGGMIGAGSEGQGLKRFDAVAARQPVDISSLARTHFNAALRTSGFFKMVPSNADGTLTLEILAYGVAPVNDRNLGAVIDARATLTGRDGKIIWTKVDWAVSNTTAPLDRYEANPRLWPQAANEAAAELARKFVLYLEPTQRTVSPTSL